MQPRIKKVVREARALLLRLDRTYFEAHDARWMPRDASLMHSSEFLRDMQCWTASRLQRDAASGQQRTLAQRQALHEAEAKAEHLLRTLLQDVVLFEHHFHCVDVSCGRMNLKSSLIWPARLI